MTPVVLRRFPPKVTCLTIEGAKALGWRETNMTRDRITRMAWLSSGAALALAMPALAGAQTPLSTPAGQGSDTVAPQTTTQPDSSEEVVVTGVRASIGSAQAIK